MNYLAHLFFSDPTPLAWSGTLLGDFVKGAIDQSQPPELTRHLQLHRHIDSYTQRSPAFQTSRRCLNPRYRYARSILVDVFYDHFLARNWESYSQQPLVEFSRQVYRGLESCYELLTPGLQQQLPHMIEHDWLTSYQDPDVVARVLQRLEARLQHRFPLAEGILELAEKKTVLERDFAAFMVEVDQLARIWKQQDR